MKVSISRSTKESLFVSEMPIARQLIRELKEDEQTVKDYAKWAMSAFGNDQFQIFDAKASIAKHTGVYDAFFDGSYNLDVWIEFIAFNSFRGAYEIGVYLTDIWQLTEDNHEDIKSRMYCKFFAPVDSREA